MRPTGGSQWCSAFNCKNNKAKCPSLKFFRFPKDEERSKKWVINSRRADLMKKDALNLYKNCKICSQHFEDNQFVNSDKMRLKWNAIPTLFDLPKWLQPERRILQPAKQALSQPSEGSKKMAIPRVPVKRDSLQAANTGTAKKVCTSNLNTTTTTLSATRKTYAGTLNLNNPATSVNVIGTDNVNLEYILAQAKKHIPDDGSHLIHAFRLTSESVPVNSAQGASVVTKGILRPINRERIAANQSVHNKAAETAINFLQAQKKTVTEIKIQNTPSEGQGPDDLLAGLNIKNTPILIIKNSSVNTTQSNKPSNAAWPNNFPLMIVNSSPVTAAPPIQLVAGGLPVTNVQNAPILLMKNSASSSQPSQNVAKSGILPCVNNFPFMIVNNSPATNSQPTQQSQQQARDGKLPIPAIKKTISVPSRNANQPIDKCTCTCFCKKCRATTSLEVKWKQTKKKLNAVRSQLRRLQGKVQKLASKQLSLRQITFELKQHMSATAYEFFVAQFRSEREQKNSNRWHKTMKELVLTVYRDSPRAYEIMTEHFELPSKKILLRYEDQLKDLLHFESEMLNDTELFDESSFFLDENGKETENKENKNNLVTDQKEDKSPRKNSCVETVDSRHVAFKTIIIQPNSETRYLEESGQIVEESGQIGNQSSPKRILSPGVKKMEESDSSNINANTINIQPIAETHYIEEPEETDDESQEASTMYIQDSEGNLHPIEELNSTAQSEFIIVENENSLSVMEAAQNGASVFFQDSEGNLHPIDGTSSASQSMFVEESIGVDENDGASILLTERPEHSSTHCSDNVVTIQESNFTSPSVEREIDQDENERQLEVLLTAASVVTSKDTVSREDSVVGVQRVAKPLIITLYPNQKPHSKQ